MISGANLAMIETVAEGLEELLEKVVFIGGASACLLIDDPVAETVRPTEDVDCVVELTGRAEYSWIESELRRLGFTHVMEEGAPVCRWRFRGVLVDVMPDDAAVLGFSNAWYREGVANGQHLELPGGLRVRCFTLPFFIATKIEAFLSRGADFHTSHDIEDIVLVLDGQLNLEGMKVGPPPVISYLQKTFAEFLTDGHFAESVYGHLPPDLSNLERAARIIDFLKQFAASAEESVE